MTTPGAGETDRSLEAPGRASGAPAAIPALTILLLAALALRLIIAYVFLPDSGFQTDIGSFAAWANALVEHGPGGFYDSVGFADYLPGYLYVLWLVGLLGHALGTLAHTDPTAVTVGLLKLPAIAADIAAGWLIYRLARRWIGDRPGAERLALIVAALYLFNPAVWYDSAIWGQVDSVATLVALAAVALLVEGHSEGAAALTVLTALVKPQYAIVLLPILGAVLLRRHLLSPGSGPTPAGGPSFLRRWAEREQGFPRLVSSAVAGIVVLFAVITPFGLDLVKLAIRIGGAAGTYPYLTVNAYNPWAFVGADGASAMAFAGLGHWSSDTVALLGGVPGVLIGSALLASAILLVFVQLLRRADRRSILLAAAFLSLACFLLPTRVHERYLFPAFIFLPLLAVFDRRLIAATIGIGVVAFLNLHGILTEPLWGTLNVVDLGFGDIARDPAVIGLCVAVELFVFGLLGWWSLGVLFGRRDVFRAGTAGLMALGGRVRRDQPAVDLEPPPATLPADRSARSAGPMRGAVMPGPWLEEVGRPPPGTIGVRPPPGRVAGGPPRLSPAGASATSDASGRSTLRAVARRPDEDPDPGRFAGLRALIASRLALPALRRDRSAALADEPRGRLDRLDLLLVLIVVLAALVLRAWRVGEPLDMYFDEVYHARTATEFLQDWRYGEPHPIYEFTHPHLAKYLIAAGIVAFGRNEVSATAQLGYAARDATIETAWDPGDGSRRGDWLFVSGPDGVHVYDLASRAEVATIALGGGAQPGALAVDAGAHRLLVGDLAGGLWDLDTTALDDLRTGPATSVPAPVHLADLGAAARTLAVHPVTGSILAVLADGHVAAIDPASGAVLAQTDVPGAADVIGLSGGVQLVVDASTVSAAEMSALATTLGQDLTTVRAKLAGATGDVVLDVTLTADQRTAIQAAIDKGSLLASRLETSQLAAVAATEGVVLVDAGSLARVQAFPMSEPATGLALVDKVSTPTLYVASGSALERIEFGDTSPPVARDKVWMPGPIRDVIFDPATKLVHALGTTPDGKGETVYVVEPHGNAVFADARLPIDPVTWALDAQPDHPAGDREQLLTIASDGSLAVVEVGGNAFGWRFPGVIAGALLAGLLFLLARLLVRRRSVALLVAGLVLLDGMFFAQARIAMNDTYVGLFIVAAYTVFAALYVGSWRGWSAVLIGLPLVGLLLGLALAAKWVGLYAIGGIVLLVLLRSALGRILALLAMIGLSGVLGWLAITAPSSSSPGVVGMTVATAVVVAVAFVVLRRLGASDLFTVAGLLFAATTTAVLLLVKGDALFLVLMVALTILLAVAMALRPVTFTLDEVRFAVLAPGIAGSIIGLAAIAAPSWFVQLGNVVQDIGLPGRTLLTGTGPLAIAMGLLGVAVLIYLAIALAARRGLGPLAPLLSADEPGSLLESPSPAPDGWLLPGWRWGIPWLWALFCLSVVPLAVYVASYIPWVALGNRWTETFPAGNTGQTFLALQISMYQYHNDLRATHAASSPWWAWPFDLKPVWFYLGTFGARTSLIYDAGNLVLFWLSVPAMAWTAFMAWRRRSLALTLIVIAFLCQWLPWSRIDRVTFQYHYYASLPFVFLALAYFLAELWHGPSGRTWLVARLAVAGTLVATPLLWLFRDPLCGVSGVLSMNPNSQACGYVRESFVLSDRAAAVVVVLAVGLAVLVWQVRAVRGRDGHGAIRDGGRRATSSAGAAWILAVVASTAVAVILVIALVPEAPLISAPVGQVSLYVVALAMLLPLGYAAWLALGMRDPRRLVVGVLGAAGLWFILFYPDISALALPSGLSRLYQVLPLPTYNYDFQFATNTAAAVAAPLLGGESLALAGMVAFLAGAAMYATWTWRLAAAAEAAAARDAAAEGSTGNGPMG
ncbi:MAG: phospholipid carrier-dependent glycosyltransferase [Candidatus Limnocylindrales bacterium]